MKKIDSVALDVVILLKLFLIVFIITVFLPAPQVYACTPNPIPRFGIIIDSSYCFFYSSYENISADDDVVGYINNESRQPSDGCNDLVLTEKDQEIVRDMINERNKKRYFFAVIYLEKESDIEYADFQKFVVRINEDKCDCKSIGQIIRYDGWTAYVESEACAHDTMCQRILPDCQGSSTITTVPPDTTAAPETTAPPTTTPAPTTTPPTTTSPPTTTPTPTTTPPTTPPPSTGICGPTSILLIALLSGLGVNALDKKRK